MGRTEILARGFRLNVPPLMQLRSAKEDIKVLLRTKFCYPILVRLGWHDAGTCNKNIEEWPQKGGANGSLRFEAELKLAANAGGSSWWAFEMYIKQDLRATKSKLLLRISAPRLTVLLGQMGLGKAISSMQFVLY